VTPGRPVRRRRGAPRALLALLALVLLAAGARFGWLHETRGTKIAADAPAVTLVVPAGASADAIGQQLQALGLVRHSIVFRLLARSRGVAEQLKAGEYALAGPLSLEGVLDLLARGDVVRREVTVPEGRSLDEIAGIVGAQGISVADFLAAAHDPGPIRDLDPEAVDLEGYLFPDTYRVASTPEAARVLARRMAQRFREVITPELGRIAEEGFTVRQVVTLASVIELETARAEERPRIAAVFLNRLQKRMPLQTDPTIIYALRKAGRWDGNIRKRDLDIDSPYNSYHHPGLPPSPIGSPGRESIRAVLVPAETKDLYFVSRNDGTHQFSRTLAEHNRAVNRYQRRRESS
jgi:UPF0755 protein